MNLPFTPLHMGPGLLIKSLLQGRFSLMVFGWSQIVMDIQPLIAMVSGTGTVHGFTHTYVGATLIALVSAVTGRFLAPWALANVFTLPFRIEIRWRIAFLSAFVGAYSHVALDSIMHRDIQPLLPFAPSNALLAFLSVPVLHEVCLYSGLAGGIIDLAVSKVRSRQDSALEDDVPEGTRT